MALVSVLLRPLDEPLPLDVVADLTGQTAARVAATGPHPDAHPGTRWHVRLRSTLHYDVWLIGWGPDSAVDVHDHGTSVGAFTVIRGALVEQTPRPGGGARRRTFGSGDLQTFEAGRRHGVANKSDAPATSVHLYSPPLAAMTFFAGEQEIRTESVDLPPLIEDRRA